VILPNATIGILGGGQLARMLALAAKPMGYRVVVLDPDPHCPASSVVEEVVVGGFDDAAAFQKLASLCDVVTLEFENVPSQHLHALEQRVPLRPSSQILSISRDRILEKKFLNSAGAKTAPYWEILQIADLVAARFPAILKTATLGYDGKGQVRVANLGEAEAAFLKFGSVTCVLEGLVDFSLEVSVLVARSSVETRCFPVLENQHKNGILDCTLVPARVSAEVAQAAKDVALQIANALELHGLLCIEMFVADGQILVNEIAPRPHNSGHVLTETCQTSQFEQAIRAVCNLPLGGVTLHSSGAMANLLGDMWQAGTPNWAAALEQGAKLHLYQKQEARTGRKMGHLVMLDDSVTENSALEPVRSARAKAGNSEISG
jgi:5-(carboxyamino)imidazole ribonucleotide synthase